MHDNAGGVLMTKQSDEPEAVLGREFGNLAAAVTAMSREIQGAVVKAIRDEINRMAADGILIKPVTPEQPEANRPRSLHDGNFSLVRDGLQELVERIEMTRDHVSALTPAAGESDQILAATSELKSVVDATEQATQTILTATEAIQAIIDQAHTAGDLDTGLYQKLGEQSIQIMTACSFQDLTGQRISATVNTLMHVEAELKRLVELWEIEEGLAKAENVRNRPDDNRPDKHLLHGPQADGKGVSQDDIDSMLRNW
ncbi:protein phosphatase CheZ [Haematospirillum sp. H1815]|nr:protein phosphatase CheZ [Haematospirillum sp. H4890]NKD75040.1 protein phosphatase CheZ [Haematospirillum sp. H4485]NKD77896.1 protein phosphatase CheZ [Haematospirillum sp. H1815]